MNNNSNNQQPPSVTQRIAGNLSSGHAILLAFGLAMLALPQFISVIPNFKGMDSLSVTPDVGTLFAQIIRGESGLSLETRKFIEALKAPFVTGFTFEVICMIIGTFAIGLGLIFIVTPLDVNDSMRIQGSWEKKEFSLGAGSFIWLIVVALPVSIAVAAHQQASVKIKIDVLVDYVDKLVAMDKRVTDAARTDRLVSKVLTDQAFRAPYDIAFNCAYIGGVDQKFAVRFGDDIEIGVIQENMTFTPKERDETKYQDLAQYTKKLTSVSRRRGTNWDEKTELMFQEKGETTNRINDFLVVKDIEEGQRVFFSNTGIAEQESRETDTLQVDHTVGEDMPDDPTAAKNAASAKEPTLRLFAVIAMKPNQPRRELQGSARSQANHTIIINVKDVFNTCVHLSKKLKNL